MNHQKIYDDIIENAKKQNRSRYDGNYYEDHHIVPHCIGGSDVPENRILLTPREHFVCHKLLTYIYKRNYKIYHAFHLMAFMNKRKYEITSRDYEYAIELFRQIPIDHTGEKNPMYGKKQSKLSIEKNKNSQPYTSKNFPQWLKDKLSEKSKGENNPMFGKTFYEIWEETYGKEEADKKLLEYKNNKNNRTWIKNLSLNKCKQVKKEQIEIYLNQGWELGRLPQKKRKSYSPETIQKLSNIRKEYWQRKKQLL